MGAFRTASTGLAAAFLAAIAAGCSKPAYDTSTPQQAIDAVQAMLADGRPELLPTMIHIEARDIVYDDVPSCFRP